MPEQQFYSEVKRLAFVLLPNYSLMPYVSLIEPLRIANRVAGKALYEWGTYSLDGQPVAASIGLTTSVDGSISDMGEPDITLVCSGIDVERGPESRELGAILRKNASRGKGIGSVCTGAYILAKYDLLSGYRCTIHWENLRSFREDYPHIEVTSDIYEIDRNRYTCAGGTAALDMMLGLIALHYGVNIARESAEILMHHHIRSGEETQRFDLEARLGVTNPKVLQAIGMMDKHIEDPLSCQQLAMTVEVSPRQLERLFRRYFNCTPGQYYLRMRLEVARDLLRRTNRPILDIAIACGFASTSHFTKCYRERYRCTPTEERQSYFWSKQDKRDRAEKSGSEAATVPPASAVGAK